MTAHAQIARSKASVKDHIMGFIEEKVDALLDGAGDLSGRALELAVWDVLCAVGRELLSALLAMACWSATAADGVPERGLGLRMDRDYWLTQMTTLGAILVPLFAYRDEVGKVRCPAKEQVFPLHSACRSSELCLEWETRLGSQLPFRQAQEGLTFFTHGATELEDSTIARHCGLIGAVIDRSWTYRSPEDIAEILADQATRDAETGKPLLYLSTDAHALRRYVDDSFDAPWKMVNGIRLWCMDRTNGQVIHLGGEYTWGDCQEVAQRFRLLVTEYVPVGPEAPQVVLLTDGVEWIRNWVFPEMPEGTLFILDFYHAIEHIAEYARSRFGIGTKAAKSWYSRVRKALFGKRGYRRTPQTTRRGHRKRLLRGARQKRTVHASTNRHGAGEALARELIDMNVPKKHAEALAKLLHYVSQNADRMDYPTYRSRGIQVGSGAMESLHRIASQMRLKLAGARWLPENAIAIMNARMMMLADRWTDFWDGPGLTQRLQAAFGIGQEATS